MNEKTGDRLAAVRQKFIAGLMDRADTLEGVLNTPSDERDYEHLQTLVHKIAGSAGFYGEQKIADTAQKIDVQLQQANDPAALPTLTDDLRALILILRAL